MTKLKNTSIITLRCAGVQCIPHRPIRPDLTSLKLLPKTLSKLYKFLRLIEPDLTLLNNHFSLKCRSMCIYMGVEGWCSCLPPIDSVNSAEFSRGWGTKFYEFTKLFQALPSSKELPKKLTTIFREYRACKIKIKL